MRLRINFKCNTFVKSLFMGKKVVGIAMGGYSSEREISLESGNTVYKSLPQSRWECYRIVVDSDRWTVVDTQENHYPLNREDFSFKMDEKNIHFDVVFNAILLEPLGKMDNWLNNWSNFIYRIRAVVKKSQH